MVNFKEMALFAVGAVVGAGVSYVVTENVTRKKYNKYAEDAIAEMKEVYEERIARVQEAHIKDVEDLSGRINQKIEEKNKINEKAEYYKSVCEAQEKALTAEANPTEEANPTTEAMIGKSSLESSKKKATKKKTTKKKEAEPKKVQAPEEHKKMIQDSREITSYARLISDVDFDEDDEFDRVNLVYDPNKDVLYDEDGSIIDVEERLGSRDVFDHIGEYYPDKVYVSNDYFMQKYEVAYCPDYDPENDF